MNIPAYSPGCFGSALTFKATDLVCQRCPYATQCKPAHEQALAQLRHKFGIAVAETPAPVPAAPVALDPAALSLPKKVQDLLMKLDRGNYDVVGKLQRGENPFGAAIPFMAVACHVLLRLGRPMDRDFLATAFMKKFGWQKQTADEHARIAIYGLMYVGAVVSNDGLISIKETVNVQLE
jgi:hypothetical protein